MRSFDDTLLIMVKATDSDSDLPPVQFNIITNRAPLLISEEQTKGQHVQRKVNTE